MQRWLEAIWYRSKPPPAWLRAFSRLYGSIAQRIAARRALRAVRLAVPVIVVGNITVGGTGKTPVTLWLVDELLRSGRRPGILSRGYGGKGPFPSEVTAESSAEACGDEPVLMAQRSGVPIAVAPDRIKAARLLLERHPQIDVLVCDDGLQHARLARDFEICVVDGARGFGNGYLLPAGPLREPAARIASLSLVLINGAEPATHGAVAERFDLRVAQAVNLHSGEARPLSAFASPSASAVHAIAGIGHPRRFFDALRSAGLIIQAHEFSDHHLFSPGDLGFAGDAPVLMTEKDAVKVRHFAGPNWWSVPARLEFEPAAAIRVRKRVLEVIAARELQISREGAVHEP